MGALFNTDKTIRILNFLNNHYKGNNFTQAQARGEHATLRNARNGYNCAQQLGLDDAGTPGLSARWKTWLDLLDAYPQGTSNGGQLVRTMMADALQEANCNGIEFFAVPASQFKVIYPAPKVPDPVNPNQFTRAIVVETNTVDNTIAFTPVPWWRRIFSFLSGDQ